MMSRAAQTHLASHMRPAGRVFETPDLGQSDNIKLLVPTVILIGLVLQ